MSNETNALTEMLALYEANNKPKFEKSENKNTFDEKNYFTTFDLAKDETSKTKEIRMLPNPKGGSPITVFHGHTAVVENVKKTFACLEHEKGTACPFCEAREALLATGKDDNKELAKKYNAKKMYIAKVIDREHEEDGVKFWRFNHDFRKEGIFDKIHGVVAGLKKFKDITSPTEGRDLSISINRNQANVPVVSSITPQDSDVLSTDEAKVAEWLSDTRTWEDGIYSLKSYEYLAIIVRGYTPIWDKESKSYVAKELVKEGDSKEDNLNSEIVMGVENVKSNVVEAETKTNPQSTTLEEDDSDDLPF